MSRWFVCLILGLLVIVFAVWKADADAALPVREPAAVVVDVAEPESSSEPADTSSEENTEAKSSEDKPEDEADSEEKPSDDTTAADTKNGSKDDAKDEKNDEDANNDDDTKPGSTEDKSAKKSEEEKKPKPHTVQCKPLKIEVTLDGYFVADQMAEIALRPEVWTRFKVLEALEHGTPVKKGQVLIRFDTEKIEEELTDESIDQRIGELSLMQEEEEFPRNEKLLDLKYEQAKTEHEQLLEDFEYYTNTDRPFMVRIAEHRYNSAKEDLESQREELAQLEKMYAADELTEETEAIVLRRQRFEVATSELILELQADSRKYTLDVYLPREDENWARRLKESQLKFEQVKTQREMGSTRSKYELEKKRDTRVDSVERHAKLVSDRALMELRAPTDGVVYYGRCIKGKWSEVSTLAAKLRPFGTVTPNTVLMTIVQQNPLHVETKLTEKNLPDFKPNQAAMITPGADDKLKLPGKVVEIKPIPDASGNFATHLEVDLSDVPEWLVAGMTCKTKVTVYENKNAILIPVDMVQTDEEDETNKYVMLVESEEADPVRRDVKLGRSKDKLVEVLRGLNEGDQIVKEEKKEHSSKDD